MYKNKDEIERENYELLNLIDEFIDIYENEFTTDIGSFYGLYVRFCEQIGVEPERDWRRDEGPAE